ncbi:hypothetical protein ACJIZ3_004671 [Penstemon smallii]|uniref:Uncharacterized protein n=1 Tax=Penstemon smallii TaxID=265156 RepID=A0ABD3S2S0_9LAMI
MKHDISAGCICPLCNLVINRKCKFYMTCYRYCPNNKFDILMEEESEKRRERIMAMRMEAAQSGTSSDLDGSRSTSHGLCNPLIERETPVQYSSPRFDYYTDPMSAFSASKRRNDNPPQVSPQFYNTPPRPVYSEMTPSPTYQSPTLSSPDQRTFQPPGAHYIRSPSGMVQGNPPRTWGGSNMAQGNPPRAWGGSNIAPGNPTRAWNGSNMAQGNPPRAWGGSNPAFNYNYLPNLSRGSNFTSSEIVQGGSPFVNYGQGSPYPRFERGRGRSTGNSSMSRGSGRGGGRRGGFHGPPSAELRPDLYYKKEMTEDPWKLLNPVVFKSFDIPDSEKSWLPPSLRMKKSKVSTGEASDRSISQPTLAEILAASFNDSGNEAAGNEPEA